MGRESRRLKIRPPALPYLYPLAIEGMPVDAPDPLADALFWRALDLGFPSARRLFNARFIFGAKVTWMPGFVWVPAAGMVPADLLSARPSPDESDVRWLTKQRRRAARRWLRDQPPSDWPPHDLKGRPLRARQTHHAVLLPLHGLNPNQCEEKR